MLKNNIFFCCIISILFSFNSQLQGAIGIISKPTPQQSDHVRYALVIGNSNYKRVNFLKSPVNDARDMANLLQKNKFHVTLLTDAGREEMDKAISIFGNRLRGSEIGLFYFGGYGIQVNGSNFLIPVGSQIDNAEDVQYEAINANIILSKMKLAGNRFNIVFLDACRNNPYSYSVNSSRTGLAPMYAPKDSFISFAAAPGSVVADSDVKNGLYTKHILQQFNTPGLNVVEMMRRVRLGVQTETNNSQVPYEVASLTGNFFLSGKTQAPPPDSQPDITHHEIRPEGTLVQHTKLQLARVNSKRILLEPTKINQSANSTATDLKLSSASNNQKPLEPTKASLPAEPAETVQIGSEQPLEPIDNTPFTSIKSALTSIANLTFNVQNKVSTDDSGRVVVHDRFLLENGTVHDLETGLMWASSDNGADIDWESAETFCHTYNTGGYADWRMPTLKELQDLQDASVFASFQVSSLFDFSACCLWSSDCKGNIAANYYFSKDQIQWALKIRKSYSRILPVRVVK